MAAFKRLQANPVLPDLFPCASIHFALCSRMASRQASALAGLILGSLLPTESAQHTQESGESCSLAACLGQPITLP